MDSHPPVPTIRDLCVLRDAIAPVERARWTGAVLISTAPLGWAVCLSTLFSGLLPSVVTPSSTLAWDTLVWMRTLLLAGPIPIAFLGLGLYLWADRKLRVMCSNYSVADLPGRVPLEVDERLCAWIVREATPDRLRMRRRPIWLGGWRVVRAGYRVLILLYIGCIAVIAWFGNALAMGAVASALGATAMLALWTVVADRELIIERTTATYRAWVIPGLRPLRWSITPFDPHLATVKERTSVQLDRRRPRFITIGWLAPGSLGLWQARRLIDELRRRRDVLASRPPAPEPLPDIPLPSPPADAAASSNAL